MSPIPTPRARAAERPASYRPRPGPRPDAGMSTAEYAIGTVSACAFAAVLYLILTSAEIRGVLTQIVTNALQNVG